MMSYLLMNINICIGIGKLGTLSKSNEFKVSTFKPLDLRKDLLNNMLLNATGNNMN